MCLIFKAWKLKLLLVFAQLEAFEVNVSADLRQQLASVVQELGVTVPPPVSHAAGQRGVTRLHPHLQLHYRS